MKVWVDILTPKQLLFFEPMVKKLRRRHTVVCTGRRYRELSGLAGIRRFRLREVGRHGGGEKEPKLRASVRRMSALHAMMARQKPDLTVSFCSPDASRISYGLGIDHIGVTDAPHSIAVMRLSVPLLQKLLIPAIIPKSRVTRFGIGERDVMKYNALDSYVTIKHSSYPGTEVPFSGGKRTILVRMEEEQAAYIPNRMDTHAILEALAGHYEGDPGVEVVVLGRYTDQIRRLKRRFGRRLRILSKTYDGKALLENADVFIGSGGSMIAEAALLGTPTISYNAVPNITEEYLIRKRTVRREENPDRIARLARRMLTEDNGPYARRGKRLMSRMQDPYEVLAAAIRSLRR